MHIDDNPILAGPGILARRYLIRFRLCVFLAILPVAGLFFLSRVVSWILVLSLSILCILVFQYLLRSLWQNYRVHKEFDDLNLSTKELIKKDSTEEQAVGILDKFNATGAPFCLFLRSFEGEAYDWLTPEGTGSMGFSRDIISYVDNTGDTEIKLAAALKDLIPPIAISNPSAMGDRNTKIPRIELPNEGWADYTEQIMNAAHFILFDLQVLSPGVLTELERIIRLGKAGRTIIILPSSADIEKIRQKRKTIKALSKAIVTEYQAPVAGTKELAAFDRVISSEEIPFADLGSSPIFSDLLLEARLLDQRIGLREEYKQVRTHTNQLIEEQRLTEAFQTVEKMLQIAIELDEISAQAESNFLKGLLHFESKDWNIAAETFRTSIDCSQRSEQPEYETRAGEYLAYSMYYKGVTEFNSNDLPQSAASLEDSLSLAKAQGNKEIEEQASFLLSLALDGLGQRAKAIENFRASAVISKELGHEDRYALCQSNIGALLLATGNPDEAVLSLRQAMQYHSVHGKTADRIFTFRWLIKALAATDQSSEAKDLEEKLLALQKENEG